MKETVLDGTIVFAQKIYGLGTMRYLLNFVEYFWCRDDIEYLDIVFGNDGSKKSLLIIEFRLDFAIHIVVTVIKK